MAALIRRGPHPVRGEGGAHLDEEAISGGIGGAQNDIIPGAVGEVRLEVGGLGLLAAPALHPREATHPGAGSTATLTPHRLPSLFGHS